MVTPSRASTTLSSISPMKLQSNQCVMALQGPHYATSYPCVRNSPPILPLTTAQMVYTSEILAYMDAVFVLSATRCLHQNSHRQTVFLAVGLGPTTNRTAISSPGSTFVRTHLSSRQIRLRPSLWPKAFWQLCKKARRYWGKPWIMRM